MYFANEDSADGSRMYPSDESSSTTPSSSSSAPTLQALGFMPPNIVPVKSPENIPLPTSNGDKVVSPSSGSAAVPPPPPGTAPLPVGVKAHPLLRAVNNADSFPDMKLTVSGQVFHAHKIIMYVALHRSYFPYFFIYYF